MGFNKKLMLKLFAEFSNITNVVFDGDVDILPEKTRNRIQLHYLWVSRIASFIKLKADFLCLF